MGRRKAQVVEEGGNDIDLTPMLDVVFIMLIFFIVTASFVKEAGIEANRPEASANPPPPDLDNPNVLIRITSTDEVWIDNRRVDVRSVRSIVERKYAENPKAAVVVQANPASTTEIVASVIDSSRDAGIYAVQLATTPN